MNILLKALLCLQFVLIASCSGEKQPDVKQVFNQALHANTLQDQRDALILMLKNPEKYQSLLMESLAGYQNTVYSNPDTADRIAYIIALIGNASAANELATYLPRSELIDHCIYSCAPVFSLAIQTMFRNWKIPDTVKNESSTVSDLYSNIRSIKKIRLVEYPLESIISGSIVEDNASLLKEKSISYFIKMAGPGTKTYEIRLLAACKLETLVIPSDNLLDLYLLAINNITTDASQEYLNSIHAAIYRTEMARVLGK